jgi:hypothetical protein
MSAAEERRRHVREALDHAALLEHAETGARPCRLRDVSVSGALVVSDAGPGAGRLCPGDVVQMRFSVPAGIARDAGDTQVLSGRIVRVLRNGLGIAFLDATARALGVLRRLVEAHRQGRLDPTDRTAIPRRLADAIATFQREQAPQFLRYLDVCLLRAARDAINDRDARILMDARRTLEQLRDRLLEGLEGGLEQRFAARLRPPAAGSAAPAGPLAVAHGDAEFSLLDLDTFEHVLVAQRCLEVAERRDPRLFVRYRRALELLPPPLAGVPDPFDPQAILSHFAQAAEPLRLDAIARPVLAHAFEEVLEAPFRELIARLLDLLPAAPPLATPHAPRASGNGAARPGWERSAAPRPSAYGDHPPVAAGAGAGTVPGVPGAVTHLPARAAAGGGSAASAAFATPATAGGMIVSFPAGAVPASGSLPVSGPLLHYPSPPALAPAALASRLLARWPGAPAGAVGNAPASDWQRWFAALAARVDLEAGGLPTAERASGLYRQLLAERADLAARPPAGDLLEALCLAEAHWEALATDPLVHPRVLGGLCRLRAWLHGWGLREPGWMLKEGGPLAALLDRLAALWPQPSTEVAVLELLDEVCQRLIEDPDATLADASLRHTLDTALAVQRERVAERIATLVDQHDESSANTSALRRAAAVAGPGPRIDESTHPLRHWLMLAQAWRRGGRALLTRGRRAQPVDLVWTDPPADTFLFTDPAGEVVATMTRQELAVHLHRGTLRRLDHPERPLSLRAREALLERLARQALLGAGTPAAGVSAGGPATPAPVAEGMPGVDGAEAAPDAAPVAPVWQEADGRILESEVAPLQAGERVTERFLEVVSVASGNVAAPHRIPELAPALATAGVRRRLDLALWDHTLARAEATAGSDDWALRLSAATLLDPEGFEAFQGRLLEAAVPPRRLTLVIDAPPGEALPEGLGELLHSLDALGLRLALDASGGTVAGWRHLPIGRLWARAPAVEAVGAERDRFAALADFARWAEWSLVATTGADSLPPAELASLGVSHLATPREWCPLP